MYKPSPHRKHGWASALSRYYSIKGHELRRRDWKYVLFSFILFALVLAPCLYTTLITQFQEPCDHKPEQSHRRQLASTSECFPKAADPWWLAIFAFLGMLYMFIALAIVCDEFFVPALENIVLKMKMSNDVAGATLMAAGGSAPELFTALIGTFQESDVGFAAIVGSAVFNVLFVIGVCALSAPTPLELTWWPLARDCAYYAFALSALSVFFMPISGKKIETFESASLLVLYVGYIVMMKYNQQLLRVLMACCGRRSVVRARAKIRRAVTAKPAFRAGILNILLGDNKDEWDQVARLGVVNEIRGDVDETFKRLDASEDGKLDVGELKGVFDALGADVSQHSMKELMGKLDTNGDGFIDRAEFTVWYYASEERILGAMRAIFNDIDSDHSGELSTIEVQVFLNAVGAKASREKVNKIIGWNGDDESEFAMSAPTMSFAQFRQWFVTTQAYKDKIAAFQEQAGDLAQQENSSVLSVPPSLKGKVWFVLVLPLILIFKFTIPDTRRAGKAKWCWAAFALSIMWIGIFSFLLVGWTTVVGDTLHIPIVVMGLTFLAAGTSIPDLLSSIIVAQKGCGDMAVSSSIGSNIFDVLVGLPVPWLAYSLYYGGKPVTVNAEGLELSILILLAMLILIISLIAIAKWRMTKMLGWTFILLYFVFVAQDLARADWGC